MHGQVHGATLLGVDGLLVGVEVDAGSGLPGFHIVGQGDRVVAESRDRIRAAFRQSGIKFPEGRVTVNLAPSGLPKAGSSLDLAIAIGIAATLRELCDERLRRTLLVGELGLDGRIHPVRGTLALVSAAAGRLTEAIVPEPNLREALYQPGVASRAAGCLGDVLAHLAGEHELAETIPPPAPEPPREIGDLADVRGQETARRALEIAAAGGHNLLMVGPPGSGKTLLASRLAGLLPRLSFDAALEATKIHSVAGLLGDRALVETPPFRSPHHSISPAGMIGGGRPIRPGEISLAHRGVLFLDELPEFPRVVLESLRQPLEEGRVVVVRAQGAISLHARFQLVAAMNPCPCGHRGDPEHECECDDGLVRRYRARVSGPLLDRIDLQVAVPRVRFEELARVGEPPEGSRTVRARVEQARARQAARWPARASRLNAELPVTLGREQREVALDAAGRALLARATQRFGLSLRAHVRVLRVARTIADLAGEAGLRAPHVAEAIALRNGLA